MTTKSTNFTSFLYVISVGKSERTEGRNKKQIKHSRTRETKEILLVGGGGGNARNLTSSSHFLSCSFSSVFSGFQRGRVSSVFLSSRCEDAPEL